MKEQMFSGMLHFLDGKRRLINVPGTQDSDGNICIPAHIDIDGSRFMLNKEKETENWFAYEEMEIYLH